METFLLSAFVVALGEIGGTTHLLAAMMGVRHRRRLPLVLGIFVATLLNHTLAASVGWSLAHFLAHGALAGPIGVAFIALAVWTLLPQEPVTTQGLPQGFVGVFGASLAAFLLAEIGDKSQIAAVALAARSGQLAVVVAGSTFGMLLADIPAVLLGKRLAGLVPSSLLRLAAALLFASVGVTTLLAPEATAAVVFRTVP